MKSMALILFTALLFPFAPGLLSAKSCEDVLRGHPYEAIHVHMGTEVQSLTDTLVQYPLSEIGARSAFHLGTGAEGVVYRIYPEQGSPYILKIYQPDETEGATESLDDMLYWAEMISNLNIQSPIQVAQPRIGPLPNSIVFEDIRGETIRNILASKEYSFEFQRSFAIKFLDALNTFGRSMREHYPYLEFREGVDSGYQSPYEQLMSPPPTVISLSNPNQETTGIHLNPPNILYDPKQDVFIVIDLI